MNELITLASRLRIPAEHHHAAYEALLRAPIALSTGTLTEVIARRDSHITDLPTYTLTDALALCGWSAAIGSAEAIIGLRYIDETPTYDEQALCDALAPFIEPAGVILGLRDDTLFVWAFDGQSATLKEGDHVAALIADLLAADARAKHSASRLVLAIHVHAPLTAEVTAAMWNTLAALGFRRDLAGAGDISHYPDGDVVEVAGWLLRGMSLTQLAEGLHQRLGGTGRIIIAGSDGDGNTLIAARFPPLPDSGPVTVTEAKEIISDQLDWVDGPFIWEPLVRRLLTMRGSAIITLLRELIAQGDASSDWLLGAYGEFITQVLNELDGIHPDFGQLLADDEIGDFYQ